MADTKLDKAVQEILAEDAAPVSAALDAYAPLTDEQMAQATNEALQERKYGGRPVEAAVGAGLSAATLGLSDVAGRALGGPEFAEEQAQVRERSPIASGLGTAAGIVAPLIASGGTSAAAASAAKYVPVTLAAKAGKAAEHFAAEALRSKVRSKAAKTILEKASGGAVEGALFAEGQYVSEAALGKADLAAQNAIAAAGAGALLGAGFGGALGTVQASIPFASKTISPLKDKLSGAVTDFTDRSVAAQNISGMTGKQARAALRKDPQFFDKTADYFVDELELGTFSTPKQLYEKNLIAQAKNGTKVSQAVEELSEAASGHPALGMDRELVYGTKLRDGVLKDLRAELSGTAEISKPKLRIIDEFDTMLERYRNKKTPMDLAELDLLRRDLQKIKYKFNGTEVNNNKADVADAIRGGIREVIDETALRVQSATSDPRLKDIATRLAKANKNYSIGSTLDNGLYWRATRGGNNLKFMDVIEGAAAQSILGPTGLAMTAAKKLLSSDIRRNFTILTDMQRQATSAQKLVTDSISNFVSKSRKPAQSLSLKALTSSGYAMNEAQQAPKNRQEAFRNISANLSKLQTDPELMNTRLAKSTARIANAAPLVANEMQEALVRATTFLQTKLPKPINSGSNEMFQREYQPTSMELAKFERYLQTVEHPLSVMDDLEKGTLTSEHIEALQTVYPALYGQIQQEVLDQVASPAGQSMPYSKKVTLGILLNIPTDESLQSYAIQALQANFLPNETVESPTSNPKPVNTASMGLSDRAQTDVERVSNRKA